MGHGSATTVEEFVGVAEPRLRRALCAAFGREVGLEATAEAMAFFWENRERVLGKQNPIGFLWGVGRNKARSTGRVAPLFPPVPGDGMPWVEPGLPAAMSRLSMRQRTAVVLVHGYGWSLFEVAGLFGVSKPTVQKHVERGLAKLRKMMGVDDEH